MPSQICTGAHIPMAKYLELGRKKQPMGCCWDPQHVEWWGLFLNTKSPAEYVYRPWRKDPSPLLENSTRTLREQPDMSYTGCYTGWHSNTTVESLLLLLLIILLLLLLLSLPLQSNNSWRYSLEGSCCASTTRGRRRPFRVKRCPRSRSGNQGLRAGRTSLPLRTLSIP